MIIKILPDIFSVCKVADYSLVDFSCDYCFIGRTDEENSLVCPSGRVLANAVERSDGWRGMRVNGVLDFSLVGVLAQISSALAESKISLFAVSTFNTDYIFVKSKDLNAAAAALKGAGFTVEE